MRFVALTLILPGVATAQSHTATYGNVRVQALSASLVRIEQKGPQGFEDRETFVVSKRPRYAKLERKTKSRFQLGPYEIWIPGPGSTVEGIVVRRSGQVIHKIVEKVSAPAFFPSPGASWNAFVLADSPRLVPPPWGATPALTDTLHPETSGWDTTNSAPDIYVFLNNGGGYQQLVRDYLGLTGRIELPPLFTFGLIDSRYHPYTQETALGIIQKYRDLGFPLDMFVLDTNWRVGGSKGYDVNTKLWPEMSEFVKKCHALGVRTMINDHPESQGSALGPKEINYRWTGLTSLLNLGIDVLWYDRNWITHLKEPVPGLPKEAWGHRLYHDVTERFRPGQRPLVMSNVDGIDNGVRKRAAFPGFHRYPIYWTGDTAAQWDDLRAGVENAVNAGVDSLLPYMSEDLTGHTGKPTNELYVRFMQYGCLSPITRIHCGAGQTRFPWDYGEEAVSVVRDFVNLRYRLLPTIYSAAARATRDGTPIVRRCDLVWPEYKEARSTQQYLFGDDLLVSPVIQSKDSHADLVPLGLIKNLRREIYSNGKMEAPALESRAVNGWNLPPILKDGAIRWTGEIGPLPESGEYVVGSVVNGGSRLFVDGQVIVSKWAPQQNSHNFKTVNLQKGQTLSFVLEYIPTDKAFCQLLLTLPSRRRPMSQATFWLPPGEWIDAYTGGRLQGPRKMDSSVHIDQVPMFIRSGGLVWCAERVSSTSKGIWRSPNIEAFVPSKDMVTKRELYEDDGWSTQYARGASAQTWAVMERKGRVVNIKIGPAKGSYEGLAKVRGYRIRLNLPANQILRTVTVDGRLMKLKVQPRTARSVSDLFDMSSGTVLSLAPKDVRRPRSVKLTFDR